MEKLRTSHKAVKAELVVQAAENTKLRKEKAELRDEVKRMRSLASNAEKTRTAPSIVATAQQQMQADAAVLDQVSMAQRQVPARAAREHRLPRCSCLCHAAPDLIAQARNTSALPLQPPPIVFGRCLVRFSCSARFD